MLLAVKLKNKILAAAQPEELPLVFKLKNIKVNGNLRGCSGFVMNPQTESCVFLTTEKSVYGPIADKSMYRYARDMTDYSSNQLRNGFNQFCLDEELPQKVLEMLRSGKAWVK